MPARPETLEALNAKFAGLSSSEFREQTRVVVPQAIQFDVLAWLKDELSFDFLSDVTAVDLLNIRDAKDRFQLTYQLVSYVRNERLTVLVMLNEPDLTVRSVVPLWNGADWLEREVWDMFGIRFAGHPDHRRILMPEEFTAFPLRKDYPMQGRGERHNFRRLERAEG